MWEEFGDEEIKKGFRLQIKKDLCHGKDGRIIVLVLITEYETWRSFFAVIS